MLVRLKAESRRCPGPAARLPGHGTRGREDLSHARGGPSPTRPGHGPGRGLRGGARPAAHARAARGPRGRAQDAGRVPRHRRRGDGHEAVIARRPTVALVDELAHTNVPGAAREKRWQDVEVIRDAGIHVVSTLNVQHLESVADAVATITGAPVHERLPDDVLLRADRDRARGHEPACPAAAHEARQRLSAGARPGGPRPLLHGGQPDGPPGALAAPRRPPRRGPAGVDGSRRPAAPSSRSGSSCSWTGAPPVLAPCAARRRWPATSTRRWWVSSWRHRRARGTPSTSAGTSRRPSTTRWTSAPMSPGSRPGTSWTASSRWPARDARRTSCSRSGR